MSELASLLPLAGIALLFWLLLIRPTQRRQRDQRSMQSALSAGDEVMLTSGIFGVLTSVDDERLTVEVADGVRLSVARGAVGTVVTKAEPGGELSDAPERSETVPSETVPSEAVLSDSGHAEPVTDPADTTEER